MIITNDCIETIQACELADVTGGYLVGTTMSDVWPKWSRPAALPANNGVWDAPRPPLFAGGRNQVRAR